MKQNKLIFIILFFLSAAGLIIGCINLYFRPVRIAYIQSNILIDKYKGMEDARTVYAKKIQEWQKEIDTLAMIYETKYTAYKQSASGLTKNKKQIEEENLESLKEKINSYKENLENKAKEEDEKTTQAVLNQINSFIEDFAKENGYDYILGTTIYGNILYGNTENDITYEILKALNENYKN